MSYRFKGSKVIINGVEQYITPGPLPGSPLDGMFAVDSGDGNKLKVYNSSKSRWIILGDADDLFFDNTTSQFSTNPDNVQDAIDASGEKAQTALDTPRYTITLQHNGTVSDGTFIGYSSLIPGDDTPIIVPVDSEVLEFTFSNANSNADYTLEFRKNGLAVTPFYSVSKVNTQFFSDANITETFDAGDQIYVKYVDDGNNASDAVLLLTLKSLP